MKNWMNVLWSAHTNLYYCPPSGIHFHSRKDREMEIWIRMFVCFTTCCTTAFWQFLSLYESTILSPKRGCGLGDWHLMTQCWSGLYVNFHWLVKQNKIPTPARPLMCKWIKQNGNSVCLSDWWNRPLFSIVIISETKKCKLLQLNETFQYGILKENSN